MEPEFSTLKNFSLASKEKQNLAEFGHYEIPARAGRVGAGMTEKRTNILAIQTHRTIFAGCCATGML